MTLAARVDRDEDVADLLREIVTLNRAILAALERSRPPATLTRDDRARLARVLPAIAGSLGSELFLTRDLLESDSAALRVALRGLNARQTGRLLRRAVGVPVAGLVVERVASEAGACLWRVLEFLGDEKVLGPHAPGADRLK